MTNEVLTVSQLTEDIKLVLESGFERITVQGEISNYKHHTSGHKYFTLKDSGAQIACTMWKYRSLAFVPTDGMKVIAKGNVTVFAQRGNYQIDIESMVPAGKGDLFMAYEALKAKLDAEGYFDPDRKRELPELPMHVGVATSPTGAAVKDIMTTIERRFPACTVYFRPTLVQGDGSAEDVVRAIEELQQTPAEVIIVGRGGGSLEDLWSFNEEQVAKAIFNCRVPVISAVGHETDFTIADFTADMRAATPTAAAELVTPVHVEDLIYELGRNRLDFRKMMDAKLRQLGQLLDDAIGSKAQKRLSDRINLYEQTLDNYTSSVEKSLRHRLEFSKDKLANLAAHIKSQYPLAPLSKGFALIKSKGNIVPANVSLAKHKQIEIVRLDETAIAKVEKIIEPTLF